MTSTSSPPDDDEGHGSYASPPCFMHEFDLVTGGVASDPVAARDVARWRKAERQRLIAARMALTVAEREAHAGRIARDLDSLLPRSSGTIVSLYWPFRGEPDLRPWMSMACAGRLRTALPVVVGKGQPLVFREWTPDARLERGVWNIPFPTDGAIVAPTVVVAPLVGFDSAGFRLGYGGGFFDRTLAAMAAKPLIIGVGHPLQKIATIYPQPHDIAMDWIVTGYEAPATAKAPS